MRRGFAVALIGPDGAGKTTIAHRLPDLVDRPMRYLYMGVAVESSNRLLPTTRLAAALKQRRGAAPRTAAPRTVAASGDVASGDAPVARRSRGGPTRTLKRAARSVASSAFGALKLANRLAEEWYRQAIASWNMWRGRIVVYDRHFFIDYHAADIVAADRTTRRRVHGWLLERTYPRPHLVIYLDAPAEVLLARKGEGTLESLERRRADYLTLAPLVERFEVVDGNRPLDAVVADVVALVRRVDDERQGRAAVRSGAA